MRHPTRHQLRYLSLNPPMAERDDETGRPFIEPAYTTTAHPAQGPTVDRVVVMVSAHTEPELLYAGMTAGRATSRFPTPATTTARPCSRPPLQNPSESVAALKLVAARKTDPDCVPANSTDNPGFRPKPPRGGDPPRRAGGNRLPDCSPGWRQRSTPPLEGYRR